MNYAFKSHKLRKQATSLSLFFQSGYILCVYILNSSVCIEKKGLLMLLLLRYTISLYVDITCNPENIETEHCGYENVVLYSSKSLALNRHSQCLLIHAIHPLIPLDEVKDET